MICNKMENLKVENLYYGKIILQASLVTTALV
jgi:hypothetical protein